MESKRVFLGGEVCRELAGSRNTKPSGVLIGGLEELGNFLPLAASMGNTSRTTGRSTPVSISFDISLNWCRLAATMKKAFLIL
jgi:hypothetical protein